MKSKKNDLIKLRVQGMEKEAFQEAADMAGLSLSAWVRERLRRIVISEFKGAGKRIKFIGKRYDSK